MKESLHYVIELGGVLTLLSVSSNYVRNNPLTTKSLLELPPAGLNVHFWNAESTYRIPPGRQVVS